MMSLFRRRACKPGLPGRRFHGSDKHLNFRTVIIHSSAYVQCKGWLAVGWDLLLRGAPHERDYLLPAPSNNFRGFKTKELKYSTAFAVQTHIISTACFRGLRVFEGSTGHYYTPHSGRNFLPSAASVSGVQQIRTRYTWRMVRWREVSDTPEQPSIKSLRSKQQSPRPSEVRNLTSSLKLMTLILWQTSCGVGIFRKSPFVSLRKSYVCDRTQTSRGPTPLNLFLLIVILFQVSWLWTIMTKMRNCRTNCQKKSSNRVTEADQSFLARITNRLVQNFGQSYEEGYYISHSGKKAIRVVHCLGRCYMLPGVDYLSFSYAGLHFPASDEYDVVCKWCAKAQESKVDPGSSGTNTSSSSDE